MRQAIGAAALLLVAGCAADARDQQSRSASEQRELDRALAGHTPGTPVDCIDPSRVTGPQVIGPDTVLYRDLGNRIWRANVAGSCPGLHGDPVLVLELHGSELCRNDHFRVLERGTSIPGAICHFGSFTPYDKVR